ncbi:thermostable hemolysin [Xanthobacter sp. 91]|uniref:thermostable hemolysin n=1 Tax=Xanthobacter sp. 91 TaxID=1117244 RepID=UPI00069219E0|nr:thermostable hemolysin [Xanthobacter sp. 91]
MGSAHIVEPGDAERAEVEAFIRSVYAREYGAHVGTFAERLLCRRNAAGEILCAAGLRLAEDGFFSELYLDGPVEAALSRSTGRKLRRSDVYEVTTLASGAPHDLVPFIADIVAFGGANGLSWCFFTLTRRLSLLVRRRGLSPIYLGDADPVRVAHPEVWGRYYETEPKVFGVCGVDMLAAYRRAQTASVCIPSDAGRVLHHADIF